MPHEKLPRLRQADGREDMKLMVNGDERELPEGETLRDLVLRFHLDPAKVSVELNRRLVRSSKYDTPLQNGDEVEIVTFVGGG